MQYSIDYQSGADGDRVPEGPEPRVRSGRITTRPPFVIPSIVKTGFTVFVAAGIFFGAEAFVPPQYRPSTVFGTYDARVSAAVKAAELEQQAKYEVWAEQVKVTSAQNQEKFRAAAQAVLAQQQATYQRAGMLAQTTANLHSAYQQMRFDQVRQNQAPDVAMGSLARMFGRFVNVIEPGAGNAAIQYSDDRRREMEQELQASILKAPSIDIEGWDIGIQSPEVSRQQLDALQPLPLPEMPDISRAAE